MVSATASTPSTVSSLQPEIEAAAENDVGVAQSLLPGLLNEPEGLARLVETVLNQILAAQMTEHLGASPYERTPERQGYRNGVRPRTLTTRVGPVTLQVPQTRDGSFSPEIFKRYPRSEQAFVLALMGWWSTASRPVK